jgi:hypothetical protein
MTEADIRSETERAANALDLWELPKASVEAKRAAMRFDAYCPQRKHWFWMYYSKIMARIRAEGVE